ncbi:MAG: hypothetical protein ACR2ID_08265 [Chthoniobacterales bacterium]
MERRRYLYALAAGTALSLGAAGAVRAQSPLDPARPGRDGAPGTQMQARPGPPMIMQSREAFRDMSPQDRQRFQHNMERWRQMPAEERSALRERETMRQERIRRDAEAALRDSGLQLEAEKRQQYEQRYMQERRRVDRALRQELQDRRQRELAPLVEQLKREFSAPQPSSTPASSHNPGSPSPGK